MTVEHSPDDDERIVAAVHDEPVIRTPLTRWFDLTTPVVGAPMAGVSGGALAAAVSRAGGLGMVGVSGRHSAEFVTS